MSTLSPYQQQNNRQKTYTYIPSPYVNPATFASTTIPTGDTKIASVPSQSVYDTKPYMPKEFDSYVNENSHEKKTMKARYKFLAFIGFLIGIGICAKQGVFGSKIKNSLINVPKNNI